MARLLFFFAVRPSDNPGAGLFFWPLAGPMGLFWPLAGTMRGLDTPGVTP